MSKQDQQNNQERLAKAYVDSVDLMREQGYNKGKWVVMSIETWPAFIGARYVNQQLEHVPCDLTGAIICDSEESARALANAFVSEAKYEGNCYPMPWSDASMIVAPIG
ncbi:hypothetical protein ACIPZ5_17835 [Pseudomonas sp. NPDC089428]|uniref:hypothetical protein n=1 Tax=Pseudomonas sp. NPDC089428 TaxID=3364467 RepID=UPI0037F85B42